MGEAFADEYCAQEISQRTCQVDITDPDAKGDNE